MFVQPFGNGTSAIYAALRALKCTNRKVIVPANICPSVLSAIYHSGNTPFFVDIERERWGLDPRLVAEHAGSAGAVIAVHLFGIPCLIDRIVAACRAKGVPVIEDCAQAEGARHRGETVGGFGDVAVFSYGAGKIIDVGGGGSASTRDESLFRALRSEHDALPAADEAAHTELSRTFKRLYNSEYPALSESTRREFTSLLGLIAPRLLSRHDAARDASIARGIAGLDANISSRLEKVRKYKERLSSLPGVELMPFPEGSAPWRCNLFLEFGLRQKVLKAMLAAGKNVSSWFPDMSRFVDSTAHSAGPLQSAWIDQHVLNLWIESGTGENDVLDTSDRISAYLT